MREALERKKAIVATKLPKMWGGGGICGNQVAEIVGEEREIFNRNFGNQVAKKGGKKELWQQSCQNCRGGERKI